MSCAGARRAVRAPRVDRAVGARALRPRAPTRLRTARPAPQPAPSHRPRPRAAGRKLDRQIAGWLAQAAVGGGAEATAPPSSGPPPRALIAPHAGHRYCGHVMGHAYRAIDPSAV